MVVVAAVESAAGAECWPRNQHRTLEPRPLSRWLPQPRRDHIAASTRATRTTGGSMSGRYPTCHGGRLQRRRESKDHRGNRAVVAVLASDVPPDALPPVRVRN